MFCNKIETCRVVENALNRRLPRAAQVGAADTPWQWVQKHNGSWQPAAVCTCRLWLWLWLC